MIKAFYDEHPKEELISKLSHIYPIEMIITVSDDNLIDLYLREFTKPGDLERSFWGNGYDTDYYFEFTNRELMMRAETSLWLLSFYINLDPCFANTYLTGYFPPSDEKVLDFLNTGE